MESKPKSVKNKSEDEHEDEDEDDGEDGFVSEKQGASGKAEIGTAESTNSNRADGGPPSARRRNCGRKIHG